MGDNLNCPYLQTSFVDPALRGKNNRTFSTFSLGATSLNDFFTCKTTQGVFKRVTLKINMRRLEAKKVTFQFNIFVGVGEVYLPLSVHQEPPVRSGSL